MNDPYYQTKKHRRWRAAVLRRDKYKCQECKRYGKSTAANHAHHKKPRETHPELATTVSNGISLCGACHNKRHPEKGGHKGNANRSRL